MKLDSKSSADLVNLATLFSELVNLVNVSKQVTFQRRYYSQYSQCAMSNHTYLTSKFEIRVDMTQLNVKEIGVATLRTSQLPSLSALSLIYKVLQIMSQAERGEEYSERPSILWIHLAHR